MTSKQIRITSDLLNSPLYKMSVGFDRLFDDFFSANPAISNSTSGYPPYNVARIINEEDQLVSYEITLAIAGFTEEDIEITLEDSQLKVAGRSSVLVEEAGTTVEYIHKGIAERNFERKFKLADNVEVYDAELHNGILKIRLNQIVPDAAKPQRIAINGK